MATQFVCPTFEATANDNRCASTAWVKKFSGPPLNVFQFGAIGDGVTDDTAALQRAITAAANSAIYFPTGTYRTTSTLTSTQPIKIFGDGQFASVISAHFSSTSGGVLTFDSTAAGYIGIVVEDMQINGNLTVNYGIFFTGTNQRENVYIHRNQMQDFFAGYCIADDGTATSSGCISYSAISDNNLLGGIALSQCGDGVTIEHNIITNFTNIPFGIIYNAVLGSAGLVIANNIIANPNCFIQISRAVTPVIIGNEFETPVGQTYGASTCIQLGATAGAGNLCYSPQLINNGLSVLTGIGNPIPVYINNCRNANMQGGRYGITAVGGAHVFIDAAAVNTFVSNDVETQYFDGSGFVTANISNGGTGTIVQTNGTQTRQAASITGLATATETSVASIVLSAGVYDVSGYVTITGSGANTITGCFATLTATSGTAGADIVWASIPQGGVLALQASITIPPIRFTKTTAWTVFLDVKATFAGGTLTVSGGAIEVRQAVMSAI